MKKPTLSGFIIFHLLVSISSACDFDLQLADNEICKLESSTDSAIIESLFVTPEGDDSYKFGGDVCVIRENQRISTNELIYQDSDQKVTIDNPLIYQDGKQTIRAQSALFEMGHDKAKLTDITYQIKQGNANGKAKSVTTVKNISNLEEMTYSTCPLDDTQWYFKAENATLNQDNQIGKFRKMSLYFKDVPILYLPYASVPLANQRLSGFLIPELRNSSRNGLDVALPYYFNIKENIDATLTPRYMTERGGMIGAEFRYLTKNFRGDFSATYLPDDKSLNKDRGYAEFNHNQSFNSDWSLLARLKNVSDNKYFEDFGNNIYSTSQSFLYSFVNINGYGDNWQLSGKFNDYQIISDTITLNSQPYQTLPSISYSWFNNSLTTTLNYGIDMKWDNFYRDDSVTSKRLDATAYIEKTYQNSYNKFTPALAYRYSSWDYENTEFTEIESLKKDRTLPILSLDYSLFFEKNHSDGSYSTIEPRFFYLNVPYENQDNIPLFDTHSLTYGTGVLFQKNFFSGADRQSDANQMTLGLTQRNYDENGNEKWNLTLGEIFYFQDRKVNIYDDILTNRTSPIISEFNYFYRNWKATMSIHWDASVNETERALLKIQRKGKNNSLYNFAYRFRTGKIEQLDSSVVLPIGLNNRIIARWNYSLDANRTIEAIAGLEHKSCCWASRIVVRRYVFNENGDMNNGIFFELQLNGLGSIGRNPRRLLKQSILGYSEEF